MLDQLAHGRLTHWLVRALGRSMPLHVPLAAPATKASLAGPLIAYDALRQPVWAPRDYAAFAREGFAQNAIAPCA